jgi:hypothetical protein
MPKFYSDADSGSYNRQNKEFVEQDGRLVIKDGENIEEMLHVFPNITVSLLEKRIENHIQKALEVPR